LYFDSQNFQNLGNNNHASTYEQLNLQKQMEKESFRKAGGKARVTKVLEPIQGQRGLIRCVSCGQEAKQQRTEEMLVD
jgi:hypothetical protein